MNTNLLRVFHSLSPSHARRKVHRFFFAILSRNGPVRAIHSIAPIDEPFARCTLFVGQGIDHASHPDGAPH